MFFVFLMVIATPCILDDDCGDSWEFMGIFIQISGAKFMKKKTCGKHHSLENPRTKSRAEQRELRSELGVSIFPTEWGTTELLRLTGWWFGTFFIFPYGIIIPID